MLHRIIGITLILTLISFLSLTAAQGDAENSKENIRLLVSNPDYGGQIYVLLEVNGTVTEDYITVDYPNGPHSKIFLHRGQTIINATQIGIWTFAYKNVTKNIEINFKPSEVGISKRTTAPKSDNNLMYLFFIILIISIIVLLYIVYNVSRSDIEFYKKYARGKIELTVKTRVELKNVVVRDILPDNIISSSLPDEILKKGFVEWEKKRIKKGEKIRFRYHVKYLDSKPLKPAEMIAEVDLDGKPYQIRLNSGVGIEKIGKHPGLRAISLDSRRPSYKTDKKTNEKLIKKERKLRRLKRYK